MMPLKKLTNSRPFLKMALQGFAGDGKTMTAAVVAIGVHKFIKSTKPIAIFDTEKASKALKPLFDKEKIEVVADDENRSLAALNHTIQECIAGAADILIIDSITHVWEDFMSAYMKMKNRTKLEFQDWGVLKPKWKKEFSLAFIQAPLHIIFTGRAGYEYENEKNEEGKREIFKSGVKMKAEGETAFEPDILVFMEKHQDLLGQKKNIWRTATILKDRTTLIDGLTLNSDGKLKGPSFKMFEPAVKALLDGDYVDLKPELIKDDFEADDKKALLRHKKEVAIAEIEGVFIRMGLGTSAQDKKVVVWMLNKVFDCNSKDKLMDFKSEDVERGQSVINLFADKYVKYMNECRENQETPTNEDMVEMMDRSIDVFRQTA